MTTLTVHPRFIPWVGDDEPPPSPLASHPVIIRRHSTGIDKRETRSALMAGVDTASRDLDDPELCRISFGGGLDEDELILGSTIRSRRESRRGRNDTTTLVDFLKNHEPPADNFMSIPYHFDEDKDGGRWTKFKVGRNRSKSMPRAPRHIRLPDSAVSGVTIGGHRHIAISIPLKALPDADAGKSQYPVYVRRERAKLEPRRETTERLRNIPIRTYTNDEGVVTVLRPTAGNAASTARRQTTSSRPLLPSSNDQNLHRRALEIHQKSASQSTNSSATSRQQDYVSVLPDRIDTPHAAELGGGRWSPGHERQRSSGRHQSSREFHRSVYPARGSSMAARRHVHPMSIDGLISLYGDVQNTPSEYSQKPLPQPPSSKEELRVDSGARPPKTNKALPSPISERSNEEFTGGKGSKISLIISDPPVASGSKDVSCPSTPSSLQSRREKVRDKKRRDMEALRVAKLKAQPESLAQGQREGEESKSTIAQPPVEKSSDSKPGHGRSPSENSLSAIVVVVDVEPSTEPTDKATTRVPTSRTQRERETDTAESGGVHQTKESQMDKQIMRLYDNYRENRMRDVERRVRRLERNGDVWLRALVPVLDDMNRNLKAARMNNTQDRGIPESASDDNILGAAAERKSRQAERRTNEGKASLSQGRLMAGLMRNDTAADESEWSDAKGRSDDMSGMGSIEPLMRELASEARRRQKYIASHSQYQAI